MEEIKQKNIKNWTYYSGSLIRLVKNRQKTLQRD